MAPAPGATAAGGRGGGGVVGGGAMAVVLDVLVVLVMVTAAAAVCSLFLLRRTVLFGRLLVMLLLDQLLFLRWTITMTTTGWWCVRRRRDEPWIGFEEDACCYVSLFAAATASPASKHRVAVPRKSRLDVAPKALCVCCDGKATAVRGSGMHASWMSLVSPFAGVEACITIQAPFQPIRPIRRCLERPAAGLRVLMTLYNARAARDKQRGQGRAEDVLRASGKSLVADFGP